MISALKILRAGPYISVQDEGRSGWLRSGVSQGGAMDGRALEEGRLLVGNERGLAALEMLGLGGRFEVMGSPLTLALSGASFAAKVEGKAIDPLTSFTLQPGQVLEIGSAKSGNYGTLSISGGIDVKPVLGSRSTHIRAGFGGFEGRLLKRGDVLPIGEAAGQSRGLSLVLEKRLANEKIRIIWGAQASLFDENELQRFIDTKFEVTHEIDRMGACLATDAAPIHSEQGLVAISGAIALGDIQVAGGGRPVVLLADRQPTGGYPRIGTIIAADLADFVQRPAGASVEFCPVSEEEAIKAYHKMHIEQMMLPEQLVRDFGDPYDSHRLLSKNLISGAVGSIRNASDKDRFS
ncbi:MAG: biotin-dependent carboxyltransferase [bacterium]|nr:biotin-dependent carboxyltransferase [bacterium]